MAGPAPAPPGYRPPVHADPPAQAEAEPVIAAEAEAVVDGGTSPAGAGENEPVDWRSSTALINQLIASGDAPM